MIGPSFAAGFEDLDLFQQIAEQVADRLGPIPDSALPFPVRQLDEISRMGEEELRFYQTTFLRMQKDIFYDASMMHEAHLTDGLDGIEELRQAGLIGDDPFQAGEASRAWSAGSTIDPRRPDSWTGRRPHPRGGCRDAAFGIEDGSTAGNHEGSCAATGADRAARSDGSDESGAALVLQWPSRGDYSFRRVRAGRRTPDQVGTRSWCGAWLTSLRFPGASGWSRLDLGHRSRCLHDSSSSAPPVHCSSPSLGRRQVTQQKTFDLDDAPRGAAREVRAHNYLRNDR